MAILKLRDAQHIYYEIIEGEPQRPYLVFLHEGLGCTRMWKGFPDELCRAAGCPGIIYDRLGYGRSSPLRRARTIHYVHEYALRELPEVLAGIIPDSRYFLVGHSDGGSIALLHAAEKPACLQGIITEAAHVFVEQLTLEGIRAAVETYRAGKLAGLSRYHGDNADTVFTAWSDTWLSDFFRSWNIEYALPSIACPLLVLQGAEDQYGTAAQVESIASKTAASAETVLVEGCGHTPHLEKPDVVVELMSAFLTRRMEDGALSPNPAAGSAPLCARRD